MITAIWILTLIGLALWSLLAWGAWTLLRLAPGWAGDVKPWLDSVPFGPWLELWLPGWRGLAEALMELMQSLLTLTGTLIGSMAPWIVWGAWAVGALLMLAAAGIFHAIVRMATRPARPQPAA